MSDNPNRPNPGIVEPGTGRVPPSPTRVEPAPGRVPPRTTGPNAPQGDQKSSGFPTILAVVGAVVVIGILVWLFAGKDAVESGPMGNAPSTGVTVGAPEATTPVNPSIDPLAPATDPVVPMENPAIDVPLPGSDPVAPAPLDDPDVDAPNPADPAPDGTVID
jgi:hypothetical protein